MNRPAPALKTGSTLKNRRIKARMFRAFRIDFYFAPLLDERCEKVRLGSIFLARPRSSAAGRQTRRQKKGGPEEPLALSFAVTPQKHAYIDCDRGYRLKCIINKLR